MAVRIQNSGVVGFGTFATQTTVTHARVSVGSAVLTTRPLTTSRTIGAGGSAQFAIGEIDLVFPANQLDNAGLNALLALALNGTNALNVDLMTSATNVVATSGYSQQAVTGWSRSNEND